MLLLPSRKTWLQLDSGCSLFPDSRLHINRIFPHIISACAIASVLMTTPQQYDAIVIGSGQAGTPLSTTLAAAGMHTALIEREHVGGTCVNEGCTPTKTMVASGRVAYLVRRAADYGVHTGTIHIDLPKVRERKRNVVNIFRNGSQGRIEKTANLELIF